MLRHYFVTHHLRDGARVGLISRILGHSLVGIMLDVYRTVTLREIREEHRRFGPVGEKRLAASRSERFEQPPKSVMVRLNLTPKD